MSLPTSSFQALTGVRVLSLALNLPGPAALLRCREMGATCTKLEPETLHENLSADPMQLYSPAAYAQLHAGVTVLQANLKTAEGQAMLHEELAQTDVLLTSFRPSALDKLSLDWETLHTRYPRLSMVRIFGSTAPDEIQHAGHDLTYQAQAGLVDEGHMPASLFADMAGSLMASEAVLQALLLRANSGHGHCIDIGLAQAAQWLALPRHWGMSTPDGDVGGAHAGYRIYACQDGWVAMAALEPHFAQRLCQALGLPYSHNGMHQASTHTAIEQALQNKRCDAISTMATQCDIPLHVITRAYK